MKTESMFGLAMLAAVAVVQVVVGTETVSEVYCRDRRVEFRDCPKCDKRIRVDLAAGKAYVNLSRLEGASRNEVAARAALLLDMSKIPPARDPKLRPLMGWSSWNTFGVDISETIILETARAMATNGLKDAGYTYVNIDDGFFWGHGEDGILRFHPERFPNGMKPTVAGIHALGLKAGIYSDAGADTCGSMWGGSGTGGKDKGGVGAGLYGHDAADCKLHFNDLGFDFIKVDYCGGSKLKLDEKFRYTEIANAIKATGRTDVRLNICRWAFPGTWAADIAESWRTTKDIRANWKSVKDLIGENLYLSAYARPGHYNDMDMLEVGQLKGAVKSIFGKHGDTGLTPDEETTHFGMWCMLSSPLLIGCDVRTIPASSKALITNPYLLAVNQNDLGCQAYVVQRDGDAYVLVKDAFERFGKTRYVALCNLSDKERELTVRADALDLVGVIDAFDLVEMADVGRFENSVTVKLAPHASKFYRFDAERRVERTVYEAECAYLSSYQELVDGVKAGTAFPAQREDASGGVIVQYAGNSDANDIVWHDVKIDVAGDYDIAIYYSSSDDRSLMLSVDGGEAKTVGTGASGAKISAATVRLRLDAGVHAIRLFNDKAWMPDIDRMVLIRHVVAKMMTPWGEKVTAENAWRGYPRPQMVRENWTNLNGEWDYAVTSVTNTTGRPEKWDGKIRVPFCIESALSGVGRLLKPDEFLWYTRKISCDPKPRERILLHFGGVDFRTMVFIGHDEVTDVPHEGGQNPFTLDITDYVKKGENDLTVCVWDPTDDFINSRGKQSFKPSGCFYTRVSGIWQTVWMETVPDRHVDGYTVKTDIDRGEVTIEFKVESGKCKVGEQGAIEIENPVNYVQENSASSAPLGTRFARLDSLQNASPACAAVTRLCVKKQFAPNEPVTVKLPEPVALWSPENPKLYNFTAKYGKDVVKGYFGMRKIEKRKDSKGVLRFFLNNKPYFMIGTLDQGWWPDGLLTPPSEEAMAYDVKVLKDCGFNMLRKHIKVEPQQYYAMCDRLGILVIQDLPSGSESWADPMRVDTVKRYHLQRQEMKEMMDDLQTFPCIVMWNPYNEGWSQPGEFLTHSMLDFVRRHDITRLVNGPSGCWDWEGGHLLPKGWDWNKRVLTKHRPDGECEAADTVDLHLYRGPDMLAVNTRRISFLGEFGGLGHPVEGHLWKEDKGSWGYGGIEDTKTREGLEKAYLGLMEKLGDLAEKGLGGAVYTQTTDVELEINGILTYDRKVLKFNSEVLRKAHAETIRRVRINAPAQTYDVAAYVWPAYQPEPRWAELGIFKDGKGEWQNVYEAVPKWKGHRQPLVPLWGYEDESDPKVVEKKIDAAVSHGVNVFIYDWYWYGGKPFLEDALDNGFLGAPNNGKMKFFIMYANHHVNWLWDNKAADKRWGSPRWRAWVDAEEFRKISRRWIEMYFSRPNYYRIDGKPVLMVYEIGTLVEGLGGTEKAAKTLATFRKDCEDAGLGGVHLMACDYRLNPAQLKCLGIDSATIYNFSHWSSPVGNPDYDEWAKKGAGRFDEAKRELGLKAYFPHASVGWDVNPRYPVNVREATVLNSTPAKFEEALKRAKEWSDANTPDGFPKLITVNSWNEWTEGSYLEPDTQLGFGYLEAVKNVFGTTDKTGKEVK